MQTVHRVTVDVSLLPRIAETKLVRGGGGFAPPMPDDLLAILVGPEEIGATYRIVSATETKPDHFTLKLALPLDGEDAFIRAVIDTTRPRFPYLISAVSARDLNIAGALARRQGKTDAQWMRDAIRQAIARQVTEITKETSQ